MILSFKADSDFLLFGIGKNRELSIASPATNFEFLLVENLDSLKAFSVDEKAALIGTVKMVKSLNSEVEVKDYVIDEMGKLGFTFMRTLTTQELKEMGFKIRD